MTAKEISDVLENLPSDEEVFIRVLDSDGNPMFLFINGVTIDPEGVMIRGSEEIDFTL